MSKHFSTQSERSEVTAGVLSLRGGARQLQIAPLGDAALLYLAEFTGLIPAVTDHAGAVTVNYPRRAPRPRSTDPLGTVRLASSISWALRCTDAIAALDADLAQLRITSIDIACPIDSSVLRLPAPQAATNIHVAGPARDLRIIRPAGVPINVRIAGSASGLDIDGHRLDSVSRGYRSDGNPGENRYLITFDTAVAALIVTSDEKGGTDHETVIS